MILIKLFLAHLIGDFLFQPNSWVDAKEKEKIKAWQLYVHAGIHFLLIMILIWDLQFVKWAILLTCIHFIADLLKVYLQKENTKRLWLFIDQLIHVVSILAIWVWSEKVELNFSELVNLNTLLLITIVYTLTQPVSVIIKAIISKWTPANNGHLDSLDNAGNFIGILERLFVFVFVITGNWEAIGFLLAAKSVFRFGDLKDSKDRKLTEYVLIGTLLSFGIALLAGILFNTFKII
jgi:hypothetical protein